MSVIAVMAVTRYRTDRQPWRPSEMSPAFGAQSADRPDQHRILAVICIPKAKT